MDPIDFLEKKIATLSLEDYEIYAVESQLFSVQSKEGEIEFSEKALEQGVAVRLFKGGKSGFCCSSDWTPPYLERIVDLSYNSLSLVEDGVRFELPSRRGQKEKKVLKTPEIPMQAKIETALALEREAKNFDRRITKVRDVRYSEEMRTVILKNSRGLEAEHTAAYHDLSLMVVAEEKGDQQMAWEEEFSPRFSELDPKKTAVRAAEKAVSQLGARPIATQTSAAVLDPVVAASFLGVLSSSFLGDQVLKNRSSLKGKLGEEIYSPQVNLLDDGRFPGGYGTLPFDGEGTETRTSEVVSQGVLKEFLYDLRAAAEAGREATGNAVRANFKEPPRVGPTNFFIQPGKGSLEELFAEMGTGFWIRDVIGVHTADPVTGDFSLGANGVWMEGGKRGEAVRGVTISGNLHEILKRVLRAGEEIRFYHSYGSPPLFISALDIGGL